jgi:hypothetical protein
VSRQSEIIVRLQAASGTGVLSASKSASVPAQLASSVIPLTATAPPGSAVPAPVMADSGIRLITKRNRSGVCATPKVHGPHEGCPGRQRAAKVARPVCPDIVAALGVVWRTYGGRILQADHSTLGILSAEDIQDYALDMEAYEKLEFKQQDKFASFFTAVQRTNAIILDYAAQGLLPLTLRQIHYQMVVRHKDYPNTKISYDHLAADLVAARMAGFVPWNAIDDPTRDLHSYTGWDSAQQRLVDAASTHHLDRWRNQEYAPIVLVEKDAALGIISRACASLYVPYASCKGYGSVSALRNQIAGHCRSAFARDQVPVVIHLSDHDASGWDMPRNLEEYLDLLVGQKVDVRHLALTLDQIAKGYGDGNPLPSDPVKKTDPRAKKYLAHLEKRGLEPGAWEMDALPPADLHAVIVDELNSLRDEDLWKKVEDEEKEQKQAIAEIADQWRTPLPNIDFLLAEIHDLIQQENRSSSWQTAD